MNLYCLSDYHNDPHGLHFVAGPIDVDDTIAEFLLRDAPENFKHGGGGVGSSGEKALDAPPKDKAVKVSVTRTRKK